MLSEMRNILDATMEAEARRKAERERRLRERWERMTEAEREDIRRQLAERAA